MKVLFVGGTKRGYLTLGALLEEKACVCGIISLIQDQHEIERYEEPIRKLAESYRIPHYQTKSMKDRDYARLITTEMRPDIALVVGCRVMLPKSIYGIPPLGTLAVHDSLLPDYRGFAPINWAVMNGERQTGVTLFYLDERMDGGDIVGQETVEIGTRDTSSQIYERVCMKTVAVVLDAHAKLSTGHAPRLPQDYNAGSFTCSRTPEDGLIDWTISTQEAFDRIRALAHPYPGAFTFYQGEKLIVWAAVPGPPKNYVGRIPGRVIAISESEGYVDVLTGDGILRILEVQREGQEKVPPARIIRSIKVSLGLSPASMLMRIQALEEQVRTLTTRCDTFTANRP